MSQQISRSRDYTRLLKNVIELELSTVSNNEILWVSMGNELEIQGIEKTQISTIMRRDIEDMLYEKQFKEFMSRKEYKWHNGKYWSVTKKNGWTDPTMARNVDPHQDQDDSSIYPPNKDMKKLCNDIINVCRTMRGKSKEYKPFEDVFGEKQMSEFYYQAHALVDNCQSGLDHKTKVPINTESILLESVATIVGSISTCVKKFMEIRIENMGNQGKFLTLKQLTKFQNGGKQSQLNLLKPQTRDTALYLKYWGIQCVCKSWSIREKQNSNKLECYDCNKIIPKTHVSKCEYCHIPLYKERLTYMVNHKNKCKDCGSVNDLPQELVLVAKS